MGPDRSGFLLGTGTGTGTGANAVAAAAWCAAITVVSFWWAKARYNRNAAR